MKIFFVTSEFSALADDKSSILANTRQALLQLPFVEEVESPDEADIVLIQEKFSYKDFRYTQEVLADPFISKYILKLITLNFDDCATGLLRGLYANIPKSRLEPSLHVAVPYSDYFNELVFSDEYDSVEPKYLATWRGNTKSNAIRPRLVRYLSGKNDCQIELSTSWLDHPVEEKSNYVELILNGKFSLCPAGLAPSSFRIYESMALGRCPVIIADNFVPPAGPSWNEFTLFYPEKKLNKLHDFLVQQEPVAAQLGLKAKETWNELFHAEILPGYYARAIIKLINSFPATARELEIKRWNSLPFYWNNNWTIPQRVVNKIKNTLERA